MIFNIFATALICLGLFLSLYLPIEYYLTEVKLILPKIPPWVSTGWLILLIFIFALVDWYKVKRQIFVFSLVFLFALTSFIYLSYSQAKKQAALSPKIFSVSPKSGVQGQIITIKGVRFFEQWEKGKVVLGDQEMPIIYWGDEKIVVEQPVLGKFGVLPLYVVRSDGAKSNTTLLYKVINPKDL